MDPSITTFTRKDGSKNKKLYYICGNFHYYGSSICISNPLRAYKVEEMIINRLSCFLSDTKQFTNTIEAVNKQTVRATIRLKMKLKQWKRN
jgi:site-specific DNA recombinase